MLRLSYWILPIIGGITWLATLLGLLLYWLLTTNRTRYDSMSPTQSIAYISDVGASPLKPLFVTGCVLTTLLLDASFLFDRLLRHRGRLVPTTTRTEHVLSVLTIFFALLGTVGLVLLSVFDTLRHPLLHDVFLLLFIAGYVLSAIFICWEYQRLGQRWRGHRVLRVSFWIKLVFVVVEILLAIAFVSCTFTQNYNYGAVLEWIIAFIFSAYVFSFYVDLYPAVRTKNGAGRPGSPKYAAPAEVAGGSTGSEGDRELEDGRGRGDGEPFAMRSVGGAQAARQPGREETVVASNF
ncbi:Frag1/DRAM/Sfk1 family-domain-containing protein [Schizothecium vesticola]|uniref:Frag1/DRAM/Sfk1 family-domain-containing protein n=1 Tax=Schizothecium vesticola TaxID=314040 RepID=A0AA40KD78_9PEZI|nr:Frag1/DRAM/Sfk1 family-domain-containing protein [Schizothecium vesticola]